ncbi:MAG: response regulator [Gammaproteobacteria bacterium]
MSDDDIILVFVEEAKDCLEVISDGMAVWSENLADYKTIREILANLHTIKGAAKLVQQSQISTAVHRLEMIFKSIQDMKVVIGLSLHGKILFALDYVLTMVEAVEENKTLPENESIIQSIEQDVKSLSDTEEIHREEVLDVFRNEADEILAALREDLSEWEQNVEDTKFFNSMHRRLHTLKGGARMAGILPLGDFAHTLEEIIGTYQHREEPPGEDFFDLFKAALDDIENYLRSLSGRSAPIELDLKRLERFFLESRSDIPLKTSSISVYRSELADEVNGGVRVSKDAVRLEVNVLEQLSNLAISANISSTHVSQQLAMIRNIILRSDAILNNILDHLKDYKFENVIKNSIYNMRAQDEEFDFIELDRYSVVEKAIHQLVDELSSLMSDEDFLIKTIFSCESSIQENRKATKKIEEVLIRTRLIPFEKLKPRFERIVRQVSLELNKSVELEFSRVEGELDRNILDKIMSPIEHLIRNSIDHGIEDPESRLALNKNQIGKIQLSLLRKGPEVLIEMCDDGQGLDAEKIYHSAVKKGLIQEGINLSEKEIINLVMTPGFSTKENVTQISGRGIGMDVVNSEIKKLGGSFLISSEKGKGAKFSLRVPFTLSLNKALIFSLSEVVYALPLSALAAVTRIDNSELEQIAGQTNSTITYAGQKFRFLSLEKVFGKLTRREHNSEQMPLLLIGHERGVALPVDKLIESREIIVKSAGPQLKYIQVISGATLLEDGTVVLVLDPTMLIHQVYEHKPVKIELQKQFLVLPTIMVVDDSLTVRKVTEGLLKRHQYSVITACDGLDALHKMKEHRPEVILLDIEMPNMDGFELLQAIKQDESFKTIPVIMITSRSGEKHKRKALSLGADLYLTKPFKESELIESIEQIVGSL